MFIMKKYTFIAAAMLPLILSCKMENPLLTESKLPFGAPQFDKIRNGHYMPAFEQGIAEAKAEIDAIANNPTNVYIDHFGSLERSLHPP